MARKRKSLTALAALGTLGYLLSKRGDKKDKEKDSKEVPVEDRVPAPVKAAAPAAPTGATFAHEDPPSVQEGGGPLFGGRAASEKVRTGKVAAKAMLPGAGIPRGRGGPTAAQLAAHAKAGVNPRDAERGQSRGTTNSAGIIRGRGGPTAEQLAAYAPAVGSVRKEPYSFRTRTDDWRQPDRTWDKGAPYHFGVNVPDRPAMRYRGREGTDEMLPGAGAGRGGRGGPTAEELDAYARSRKATALAKRLAEDDAYHRGNFRGAEAEQRPTLDPEFGGIPYKRGGSVKKASPAKGWGAAIARDAQKASESEEEQERIRREGYASGTLKMKKGGSVSRGNGIAQRGKTKGRYI